MRQSPQRKKVTAMTDEQQEACLQHLVKKISDDELFAVFGCNFRKSPNETVQLLQQAYDDRHANSVEFALGLTFKFHPTADFVPLLCKLVIADFHIKHEDMVGLLQDAADPYSIPFLRQTALLKPKLTHLDYDDYGSYYKKCFHALIDIGTPEAIAVIQEFTSSEDAAAREEALYRLSKLQK